MNIIHKIDDLLFELFPKSKEAGNDIEILKQELQEYYTFGSYRPLVNVEGEYISINIDIPSIASEHSTYKKIIALAESRKYSEAQRLLLPLISKNPTNSEYHRILGQMYSDEGRLEDAVNSLIDALKWNPNNSWALIMMGNIFAREKNDKETALKYYNKAAESDPNDHIAINNIGASLMMNGNFEDAKQYFFKAISISNDYPNTHYGLSLIAEKEADYHSAFYSAIQCLKKSKREDIIYKEGLIQAIKIAEHIIKTDIGQNIFKEYLHKLEFEGGVEIEAHQDNSIPTAAKFEFAENYNRPKHLIKYRSSYKAVEHLCMHELVHLQFVLDARKVKSNQLFTSTSEHKQIFTKLVQPSISHLKSSGISDSSVTKYVSGLFEGLNNQIFNAPIDLFIEQLIFNEYAEMRPYQFISLYGLIQEGVQAVTNKKVIELSPKDILSKSKIYNLVSAIQFKNLYGLDLIKNFQPSSSELQQATEFYSEFEEYNMDKEPGEEYELLLHWAKDLKLDNYFELIDEEKFRKRRLDAESMLKSIEEDPFDLNSNDISKKVEMEIFQNSQKTLGINMAVSMHMVDALEYFKRLKQDDIKKVAFEIAMLGTQGISPEKKGYKIHSIPNKIFTGYHLLAYYYISWKLAIPEMLDQLKLPYNEEYALAINFFNKKKANE